MFVIIKTEKSLLLVSCSDADLLMGILSTVVPLKDSKSLNAMQVPKIRTTEECMIYLDQWSPPEEESKQVGHDVITDHNGDGDNEPGGKEFPQYYAKIR